jgi:hypothetical protein
MEAKKILLFFKLSDPRYATYANKKYADQYWKLLN